MVSPLQECNSTSHHVPRPTPQLSPHSNIPRSYRNQDSPHHGPVNSHGHHIPSKIHIVRTPSSTSARHEVHPQTSMESSTVISGRQRKPPRKTCRYVDETTRRNLSHDRHLKRLRPRSTLRTRIYTRPAHHMGSSIQHSYPRQCRGY